MSLLLAIIGHLVGDFILQNDWMALNKKQRTMPCLVHCWIWTTAVTTFSGWGWSSNWGAIFFFLFATHFFQDRTQVVRFWMTRIIGQVKFAEPPMAPWSLVVVDNVWHILALTFVWKFIS